MGSRIILRIEITPEARRKLSEIVDRNGMTQVATLSRLVEWFANQPETIQAAVLGRYPVEIAPDVAQLILKRLAKVKA